MRPDGSRSRHRGEHPPIAQTPQESPSQYFIRFCGIDTVARELGPPRCHRIPCRKTLPSCVLGAGQQRLITLRCVGDHHNAAMARIYKGRRNIITEQRKVAGKGVFRRRWCTWRLITVWDGGRRSRRIVDNRAATAIAGKVKVCQSVRSIEAQFSSIATAISHCKNAIGIMS